MGRRFLLQLLVRIWVCRHTPPSAPPLALPLISALALRPLTQPGLDVIDFFMGCGFDARAEYMWKISQGGGGREERQAGPVWARSQLLQDTGLPRAWPRAGHPFLLHPHADDSGF